jgi:NADH:ubiquinone oxidoreductase subunit E
VSATASRGTTVHELIADFPRERGWLLPALQAVQHAHGWLSREALAAVAAHLRVPDSEVWGVASDYPELRLEPTAAHHVRVCTGVSCRLLGGTGLLARMRDRFGGEVTVEEADCFFTCSMAPLLEVDGELFSQSRGERAPLPPTPPTARSHDSGSAGFARARTAAVQSRGIDSGQSARDALAGLVVEAQQRRAARPAVRLLVGAGSCGRSVGADDVVAALRDAVARKGIAAEVVAGACNGMCYAAPVVEVQQPDAA